MDKAPVALFMRRAVVTSSTPKAIAWKYLKPFCKLGLEGIVSKKLDAPHKSGPSKAWLKVKNPKAPAATRAIDGTF
jgi:ATP-dependent DNA ligase